MKKCGICCCCNNFRQCFSILDNLTPMGIFGNIQTHFCLSALGDAISIQWTEISDVAEHLTIHRAVLTTKNDLAKHVNSAKAEELFQRNCSNGLRLKVSLHLQTSQTIVSIGSVLVESCRQIETGCTLSGCYLNNSLNSLA